MNTQWMTRIADKTGVIGTLIGSFSCAMCFPAAASIGAVIGLSFLSRWEGLFVHILIPVFASIALAANLIGWFSHHQWTHTGFNRFLWNDSTFPAHNDGP